MKGAKVTVAARWAAARRMVQLPPPGDSHSSLVSKVSTSFNFAARLSVGSMSTTTPATSAPRGWHKGDVVQVTRDDGSTLTGTISEIKSGWYSVTVLGRPDPVKCRSKAMQKVIVAETTTVSPVVTGSNKTIKGSSVATKAAPGTTARMTAGFAPAGTTVAPAAAKATAVKVTSTPAWHVGEAVWAQPAAGAPRMVAGTIETINRGWYTIKVRDKDEKVKCRGTSLYPWHAATTATPVQTKLPPAQQKNGAQQRVQAGAVAATSSPQSAPTQQTLGPLALETATTAVAAPVSTPITSESPPGEPMNQFATAPTPTPGSPGSVATAAAMAASGVFQSEFPPALVEMAATATPAETVNTSASLTQDAAESGELPVDQAEDVEEEEENGHDTVDGLKDADHGILDDMEGNGGTDDGSTDDEGDNGSEGGLEANDEDSHVQPTGTAAVPLSETWPVVTAHRDPRDDDESEVPHLPF
jgi:hypothetical protein